MPARIKDIAYTAGVAIGGILLYVPAAIGMAVTEIFRKRKADDNRWRFTLMDIDTQPAAVVSAKSDLWSKMNLSQYFRIVPGITAIASEHCAFTRSGMALV